ncbi:hypothetical protein CR513_20739, partial [Mucuna pruriens]
MWLVPFSTSPRFPSPFRVNVWLLYLIFQEKINLLLKPLPLFLLTIQEDIKDIDYTIYIPSNYFISRDVTFHENIFPFQTIPSTLDMPDPLRDLAISLLIPNSSPYIDQPNHTPPILSTQRSFRPTKTPPYLFDYIMTQHT